MLYHKRMVVMKSRRGSGVGVIAATASSIPSRKVRMRMRTLTSHASQLRSSNVDCMTIPVILKVAAARRLGPPASSTRPAKGRPGFRSLGRSAIANRPLWLMLLASQLGDHGKQRHVERNHNAADGDAQYGDNDRLQHSQHVLGGCVHVV